MSEVKVSTSRPPDGGWGWIIVGAAFITYVLVDGVKYSFGMIFMELINTFQRSNSETALIISLQTGALLLSGRPESLQVLVKHR